MKAVTLNSNWADLFGKNSDELTPEQRKSNWEEWKRLANEAGDSDIVYKWTDCKETCSGCVYQNVDWCNYMGLPCSVNPVLTLKNGMKGMACMGTGYKKAEVVQTQMF